MKLNEKIRIFRQIKGYSQESIANILKISHTAYAKIERGETKLNFEKLEKITDALGVSTEDINNFSPEIVFNNTQGSLNCGYNNYYNETINNEKKLYEETINNLKEEIKHLKSIIDKLIYKDK